MEHLKSFKIIYTKSIGLQQIKPLEAYCYVFCDGFIHFYSSEEHYTKGKPFKSINQDGIWMIEEIPYNTAE